ncbi:MarR family winged helix-turn-helix transcriptional regulator [Roseomonas sp. HJA6]|uniref:MarR family winged helix-turn-helix transcriptional regulator n=1 Tax=Roseomonas alba TaxID=2846776 RepID=A0ABS7AD75_9PROT|nr:MarR family winged helix-turn-helix transcriptional regulator [Neoroseomonas alba]MBW6400255.1 MarR family winged helix-turn-helix transcriptional regulator [Neoroseomonas alba]
MDTKPVTEHRRTLGALLRLPYEAMQREVYGALAVRGFPEIRPAHSAVFRHIAPGGSRLTVLAERAGMTKQSMAYLVEGLQEAGLLRSLPDPSDGRARIVRLTARGEAALDTLLALSAEAETRVAERIGEKRAAKLRRALEHWVTALEQEAG